MALHVPTPNTVRISTYATLYGQEIETAVFFQLRSPPVTALPLELLTTRIAQQWDFFFRQQLAPELVIRAVVGEDLSPGSSLSFSYGVWFGRSFQSNSLPASIAISFKPIGPAIPRPWQWIWRWPAVPEARVTDNVLDPVWAEGLRLGIRDRYTLQGAFGWDWVVVQKVVGNVPLNVGIPHPVTGLALASPYVAPCRRRVVG